MRPQQIFQIVKLQIEFLKNGSEMLIQNRGEKIRLRPFTLGVSDQFGQVMREFHRQIPDKRNEQNWQGPARLSTVCQSHARAAAPSVCPSIRLNAAP